MLNRKVLQIILVTFFCYWVLVKKEKYTHNLELEVKNSEPRTIWKLLSNFTNLKKVNPTLLSYEILSQSKSDKILNNEDPDPENTEFTVVYTEYLVYFPFIHVETRATYQIQALNAATKDPYSIISNHRTGVLGTSLDTSEIMIFVPYTPGASESMSTKIISKVEYECQLILSYYCELEFLAQRALIHANIQSISAKKTHI